ncbi:hypothetical protein [Sporosarcina sp. P17b]|uniref:hypothetical protein n=1 Tax=Sporosarcina sp. P17b TaxID=2048260 RepID=UPI000C1628A3|nr:hypothetical protein [Sporosarcina sp. P17b]PIC72979.1 hypothetical protein CSV76_12545 [Sporosarcina sp. P17b]
MRDKNFELRLLYFIVFVLIVTLFVLITSGTFALLEFKMSSSLATFLGALFGAGISGGIAIYVMHSDMNFRKDEKTKENNDNFKKSYELIRMWTESYLLTVGSLHMKMKSESTISKQSMVQELEAIKKCMISLDSINDDYIPQEIYKLFLELKAYMELTYYEYSAYISTIQMYRGDGELIFHSDNQEMRYSLIKNHKDKRKYTRDRFDGIKVYEMKL